MTGLIHFVPLAFAVLVWFGLYRVNQSQRWLRVGELIFWDVILLILIFLVWLRWY